MDLNDLSTLDDNTYHYIFDKGTFDSLMCHTSNLQLLPKVLQSIYRILRPGGRYFVFSRKYKNTY